MYRDGKPRACEHLGASGIWRSLVVAELSLCIIAIAACSDGGKISSDAASPPLDQGIDAPSDGRVVGDAGMADGMAPLDSSVTDDATSTVLDAGAGDGSGIQDSGVSTDATSIVSDGGELDGATLLDGGSVGDGSTTPAVGLVSTLAGGAIAGTDDGVGAAARFSNPANLVVASDGTIFVADYDTSLIRMITPAGVVSTLVLNDGAGHPLDYFSWPFGLALTPNGTLYVQTDANDSGVYDSTAGTIWRIDRDTGAAEVVARNLGRPRGLVALSDTELVISDISRHTLRVLSLTGGTTSLLAGKDGQAGSSDGVGADASFDRPYDIVMRSDGTLVVADQNNAMIRLVQLDGSVTTLAGGVGGPFVLPESLAIKASGVTYVGDLGAHAIFRVAIDGTVSVAAGTGEAGYLDGPAAQAKFYGLEGLDLSQDDALLYVADGNIGNGTEPYNRIRVLSFND